MGITYIMQCGNIQWLYEGHKAFARARHAAKLMMRRLGTQVAYIRPYLVEGETFIIER